MIADSKGNEAERRTRLEQDALRRIATLVAQGVEPDELFAAVAEEVGRVVDAPSVAVARYEADGTATACGTFPARGAVLRAGARVSLDGTNVLSWIRERAEPTRIDDYSDLPGEIAESIRNSGMRSTVGAPIVVAGRLWGAIVASNRERLAEGTEAGLAEFTELLAAAIANTEAREALARLADEQAALRRVATLVAEGAVLSDVLAAVASEMAELFGFADATLSRYEDDAVVVVADPHDSGFPVGSRWPLDGDSLSLRVRETRRTARIDDYSGLAGSTAAKMQKQGSRSAVGVPILIEGGLWGILCVGPGPLAVLPADVESRIAGFVELVGTAIANSQARDALRLLADEQAALRRIATLVAEAVTPDRIFPAVCEQVGYLLGADVTVMEVFTGDDTAVLAAAWSRAGPAPVAIGMQLTSDPASIAARVRATRAPVVRADYADSRGQTAALARKLKLESAVGAPVIVSGRVWGALVAASASSSAWAEEAAPRLAGFAELVGTGIANAESRDAVSRLADEQAALQRVATLVAQGAAPAQVFEGVSAEVDRVFLPDKAALDIAGVVRFEPGPELLVVGVSKTVEAVPLGARFPPDELFAPTHVLRSGRSARIVEGDLTSAGGATADFLRHHGYVSQVASPIVVEGRLWGAISVNAGTDLPADTEERLGRFTELVATAIANAESHHAITRLADEQAALRRVATLVARGARAAGGTEPLFRAVATEVQALLGADTAVIVRFEDEGMVTTLGIHSGYPLAGTQRRLDPRFAVGMVRATGRPARFETDDPNAADMPAVVRENGIRSAVASPIMVEGDLWGAICVATYEGSLTPGTARRLDDFTELVATAIANADSRDALAQLAEEQAALRRVATLVARDAPPGEVFDAVAMEVGKLLDTDITVVGRYDDDAVATAIGSWSASPGGVVVGTRSAVGGRNVLTLVAETGRPARVDEYTDAWGEAADIARSHGWSASIAAPIIVESRLWGVMLVATQRPDPFPDGAEHRLAAFTGLVATAIANTEAHDEVRRFGQEQAALGRVATLAAAGAAPEQVFTAVVDEAASLLGLERIELVRYDGDGRGTVMAASGDHPFPTGTTWSLDDPSVMGTVARTRRAARVDDYSDLEGEIAEVARGAGFQSAIGAPITVEGSLWGVIIAISTDPEPIAERSEARLGQFTELVATAVANAEARDALAQLADEQAALRRVATLVAQGVPPEAIFSAVGEETARLFGSSITTVGRFELDPPALVALGVAGADGIAVGSRWELDDSLATARVFRTGRSARVDEVDWSAVRTRFAPVARRIGIASTVASPIFVEGRMWGVVIVSDYKPLPQRAEKRLEKFSELIATALANAEGSAELAASRRRIVAAADEARRRIERDLHDGIQQRLIALTFRARAMTRRPADELPGIAAELSEGLKDVSDELREVSRGIHPTILTEAGLGPALRALARRSNVPIDVDVELDERLAPPVEAAAYYIASEALTNVEKHARASVVELIAAQDDGALTLEVRDDGIGGVDAERGSGILGLTDRVEALGGTISIASPPGEGTKLCVRLPIET